MTRIEAYEDLAAKVEEGDAHAVDIAARRIASEARDQGGSFPALWVWKAHNGSLDAAKALHNAVLPAWRVGTINQFETGARWYIKLYLPMGEDWPKWTPYPEHEAVSNNPARAWLLAILRALIAQDKSHD